jgi:hypothetical protein
VLEKTNAEKIVLNKNKIIIQESSITLLDTSNPILQHTAQQHLFQSEMDRVEKYDHAIFLFGRRVLKVK